MARVETWGQWLKWPIRHIFNTRARRRAFQERVRFHIDVNADVAGHSRGLDEKEVAKRMRESDAAVRYHLDHGEIPPGMEFEFFMWQRMNSAAIERRRSEAGKQPTHFHVVRDGEFVSMVMPPRPSVELTEPTEPIKPLEHYCPPELRLVE